MIVTHTMRRQCRPVKLDQYVNHDTRLKLYSRPSLYSRKYGSKCSKLKQQPRLYYDNGRDMAQATYTNKPSNSI